MLSNDEKVLDTVIPKLVAFKSLMLIRDIQLRKAEEERKRKEKAASDAKKGVKAEEPEEAKDPKHMTEEEVLAARLEEEEKGEEGLTPLQIEMRKLAKERHIYGRYWMWEGYFNEKNAE